MSIKKPADLIFIFSIFAAIPLVPITISEQILIYSSGAIIFLLGLATVIMSKDL